MNEEVYTLTPARLWHYFGEILQIPRPSKKEEKIAAYLVDFGEKQGLETLRDAIGNVSSGKLLLQEKKMLSLWFCKAI